MMDNCNRSQIGPRSIQNSWHFFYDKLHVSTTDVLFQCLNSLFATGAIPTEADIQTYISNRDVTLTENETAEQFIAEWQTLACGFENFFKTIHEDDDAFTKKCQKLAIALLETGFERYEGDAFAEAVSISMETVIVIYETFPDLGEMISDVLGDGEADFIIEFQESCLWLRDDCLNSEDPDALYEDFMEDVVNIVEHAILFSAMAYVVKQKEQT